MDGQHKFKLKERKIIEKSQKEWFLTDVDGFTIVQVESSSSEMENHNFLLRDFSSNITDRSYF